MALFKAAARSVLKTIPRRSHIASLPITYSRTLYTNNSFLKISEEIQDALNSGKPVVALETTIYTHGFPYPENVALASHLESVVRVHGGVPATIGVLNGVARVGFEPEELTELTASAGSPNTLKISRRDLGYICGLVLLQYLAVLPRLIACTYSLNQGHTGRKLNGGTTIAGTMILANRAGIKVFATGGLGGVHRGGENSLDISADLTELGRTPVTVISSGCKSFLDIPRTLEYLETQGVGVGTFADGREGKVDFPAFWTRESGVKSPMVIKDEAEAAAIIYAQATLPVVSGLLLANPIPLEHSIAKAEMDAVIAEAVREADRQRKHGSDNTPFILRKIKELTGGRSVPANRALIESNVVRGTNVAVELSKLDREQNSTAFERGIRFPEAPVTSKSYQDVSFRSGKPVLHSHPATFVEESPKRTIDIVVAGSLAVDFCCDYDGLTPRLHTSNPSTITQTVGGVGYNVALAAQLLGGSVHLCSIVADDLSGRAALATLDAQGFDTTGIKVLGDNASARTAQYIAVNNVKRDLVLAMADMSILEVSADIFEDSFKPYIEQCKPKWLIVDSNWDHGTLRKWVVAAKALGARVALEPVSAAKATRLFHHAPDLIDALPTIPSNTIDIATPNSIELAAMHTAARDAELFDRPDWWSVIHDMGLPPSGSRDKLVSFTNSKLVDQGLPQQSIQLLPFIPCILTKLGAQGVLMTQLLRPGDARLTSPVSAPYILSRSHKDNHVVGGVYMRLFPPADIVPDHEVVSVNGVGDTFLGIIVAGLVAGTDEVEKLIHLAQQGSILTLRSKEAVSPNLPLLRSILQKVNTMN